MTLYARDLQFKPSCVVTGICDLNKISFWYSKSEEILEKVISKKSDMPDEKFFKFEQCLRNDIVNLRNDLNSVKELNKKELGKVREC